MELVSTSTTTLYKVSIQTAPTSIENPGAWSTSFEGSWRAISANLEENTGELTVSSTDMWIRVGLLYNLSSGTTATTARVSAIVTART